MKPMMPLRLSWILPKLEAKAFEARLNLKTNDVVLIVIFEEGGQDARIFYSTRAGAIEMLIDAVPKMKDTRMRLYDRPKVDEVPVIMNEGDMFYSIWWKVPGAVLS